MLIPGFAWPSWSGSGTRRTAVRSLSGARSWTARRWPARRRARRSRRFTTSATRSGGSGRRSPDVARLRAVLFDVDGTLLDTRDAWVAAFDAGLAAIHRTSMSGSEAALWIGTPIETIYAERCGLAGDEPGRAARALQRAAADAGPPGMRAYTPIQKGFAAPSARKIAAFTHTPDDTPGA